ncbi:MAG: TetR/AcrR family transcriptional regulator [Mycobacteriaceae bacterium]|nr:TetR/AcrR family transcriptional regulator [Mycobacteriaceae bacterium]
MTAQIVLSEGIAAAGGRHVVDTAGVTWGVIQYHFGDRDGLLLAVVDQGFDELTQALKSVRPATAQTPTRERVESAVSAAWRAMSSPTARAATEISAPGQPAQRPPPSTSNDSARPSTRSLPTSTAIWVRRRTQRSAS